MCSTGIDNDYTVKPPWSAARPILNNTKRLRCCHQPASTTHCHARTPVPRLAPSQQWTGEGLAQAWLLLLHVGALGLHPSMARGALLSPQLAHSWGRSDALHPDYCVCPWRGWTISTLRCAACRDHPAGRGKCRGVLLHSSYGTRALLLPCPFTIVPL